MDWVWCWTHVALLATVGEGVDAWHFARFPLNHELVLLFVERKVAGLQGDDLNLLRIRLQDEARLAENLFDVNHRLAVEFVLPLQGLREGVTGGAREEGERCRL